MTAMMRLRIIITMTLVIIASTASISFADHERFIVGEMRNIDPSEKILTSSSGTCVPSHDRERLECYFTTFGLWKVKTEEEAKKDFEQAVQEMNKDSAKMVKEWTASFCDNKKMTEPNPMLLKYNVGYQMTMASMKAFCERPTRDSALNLFRTMSEVDAKKCRCAITDQRSVLLRQMNRWVENAGPTGLCGVINVTTLVPHDIKKMKERTGPVLWTLHQKTITTHKSDDPLCGNPTNNPLLPNLKDDAITLSWDAPSRSLDCREFDFTSALEGMSDPRGPKGK